MEWCTSLMGLMGRFCKLTLCEEVGVPVWFTSWNKKVNANDTFSAIFFYTC